MSVNWYCSGCGNKLKAKDNRAPKFYSPKKYHPNHPLLLKI